MTGIRRKNTHLVEFQANQTSHKRCSRGDGGDNLPSDLFGSVAIGYGNAVIHCAKVRGGSNEVNVMVGVIILLKVYRCETVSCKGGR